MTGGRGHEAKDVSTGTPTAVAPDHGSAPPTHAGSGAPVETADAIFSLVKPEPEQPLTLSGIDGQGWWAGRNWRYAPWKRQVAN